MLAIYRKNSEVALRIIASDSVDVSAVVEVSVSSGDFGGPQLVLFT